jgi:hypothetical protein
VRAPVDAFEHHITTLAQLIRKPLAYNAPNQPLIGVLRIEDRIVASCPRNVENVRLIEDE